LTRQQPKATQKSTMKNFPTIPAPLLAAVAMAGGGTEYAYKPTPVAGS
jgi:hypothetical protein